MRILRFGKRLFYGGDSLKSPLSNLLIISRSRLYQTKRYLLQESPPASDAFVQRQGESSSLPKVYQNLQSILILSEFSTSPKVLSIEDERVTKSSVLKNLASESTSLTDLQKLKMLETYNQLKCLRRRSQSLKENEAEMRTIFQFLNCIPTSLIIANFENYLQYFSVLGSYSNLWLKINFEKRKEVVSSLCRFQNEIETASLEELQRLSNGFLPVTTYDIRLFHARASYLPVLLKLLEGRKALSFIFQSRPAVRPIISLFKPVSPLLCLRL